jgi:peptidoglycan hydrolase-like protein with peptidoglycan-binding domain
MTTPSSPTSPFPAVTDVVETGLDMRHPSVLGITAFAALAVVAAVGWWGRAPDPEPASAADTTTGTSTLSTVEVVRGDLTSEQDFAGAVTFGDSWTLPLQLTGVVTANQPVGSVVEFGEELVRVNDQPAFLGQGAIPMYRRLALSHPHLSGDDVQQLQNFLIDAGFDADGRLEPDGEFGALTKSAVKAWQGAVGLPETGVVDGSQLLFSPIPLRIQATPRVGTTFDAIEVTAAKATVTVDIDASRRTQLPVDGLVTVELADGSTREGTVTGQDRVVKADGSTGWRATIDAGLSGDDGTVLVHSVVVEANDVLIVPTSALLAVAEGGFAVEVDDDVNTRLVRVEVGKVVDARAEITGAVQPGDEVVVPE